MGCSPDGIPRTHPVHRRDHRPPTPTDTGIELTTIDFEYDGVSDFPRYGGNLLAVANAIAGFAYIHGTYLDPNQNGDFVGLPDGYTPAELKDQQDCGAHPKNCRTTPAATPTS